MANGGKEDAAESGILDDPEPCSCDESLALRAELARSAAALAEAEARAQQSEELNGGLLHRAWTLEARLAALASVHPAAAATTTLTPSARTRNGWSSRFKGVYWHAKSSRWRARVLVAGKRVSLGAFPSEDEAATAVDCAMRAKEAGRG